MALTYRTGSGGKGSALTIEELDNNFRQFTGSHDVSGSFTVSGSTNIIGDAKVTGSLTVSGSNTFTNVGSFSQTVIMDILGIGSSAAGAAIRMTGSFDSTGSVLINVEGAPQLNIKCIPTSDPSVVGQVWRDGTDLNISVG